MAITCWDLLVFTDGTASLVLYGGRPGDPATPTEAVGPLPADEARRLADWLRRGRATDTTEVRERVGRLYHAREAAG